MTSGPLIIAVDDDDDIRLLLRHVLGAGGYRVVTVESARDLAANMAGPELPSAVILDVQMPDVDGWTALGTLRADPATRHLPVVMCTVKASPADALLAWELGCDAYVAKPFDIEALVEELDTVLARSVEARLARRSEAIAALRLGARR